MWVCVSVMGVCVCGCTSLSDQDTGVMEAALILVHALAEVCEGCVGVCERDGCVCVWVYKPQ